MFHTLHNTIDDKYLFNFNYELTVICNNNYKSNKQTKKASVDWLAHRVAFFPFD